MFSTMRRHFTFASLIATVALVFAMSSGAWAAKKYLITSTSQISPSVLKKLKGSKGATGAAGATGQAGVVGPAGKEGPQGKEGLQGKPGGQGAPGTAGKSVTSTTLPKEDPNCKEGGSEFEAANGVTFACNGSPWTAGGTLPSEATETGVWSFIGEGNHSIPLSFPIPLDSTATAHYIKAGEEGTEFAEECPGSFLEPKAKAGFLCIYTAVLSEASQIGGLGVLQSGGFVTFSGTEPASFGNGSFAVTAP